MYVLILTLDYAQKNYNHFQRYLALKKMSPKERKTVVPRVVLFAGKAAPGCKFRLL